MTRQLVGAAAVMCLLNISASWAMDDKGFWTGGGVGSVSCPDFLNVMATARQRGGLKQAGGLNIAEPYVSYVAGFRTGFNAEAVGIYDILKSLGENAEVKALYAIEPWCVQHPDKTFATALLFLSLTLRENLKRE